MGQLIGMLLGVVAILAVTLGLFVGVNALVDLAPRRFGLFATLAGAVIGAVVGVIANSGGWFLGGLLWPLGGAVIGALVGGLVWARHPPPPERRWRIPDRLRPAIFLGPGPAVPVHRPGRADDPHDLPELPQPARRRARRAARTTATCSATRRSSTSTAGRHLHQPPLRRRRGHRRGRPGDRHRAGPGHPPGRRPVGAHPDHLADRRRHPRHAGGHERPARRDLEQPVLGRLRHRPVARSSAWPSPCSPTGRGASRSPSR